MQVLADLTVSTKADVAKFLKASNKIIDYYKNNGIKVNNFNYDFDTFYSILGKEAIKTGEIESNIDITKQRGSKSSLSMTNIVLFFVLPIVIAYISKMIQYK